MAKRSPKKSRVSKRPRQGASQKRRAIELLRKKGLIGRAEFRGKLGGSATRLTRKYRDVIEGNAVVVTPKTRLIPKRIKKALKHRNGKYIVPKVKGTVSTQINQGGIITRTRREAGGALVRERVVPPLAHMPALKEGQVYRVTMPNWKSAQYFRSLAALHEYTGQSASVQEYADVSIVDLPEHFDDAPKPAKAKARRKKKG